MLTTSPYLHIRRPSPTTAEFTVSTRPPLTVGLRLMLLAVLLTRFVLALAVFLLLNAEWTLCPLANSSSPDTTSVSGLRSSSPEAAGDSIAERTTLEVTAATKSSRSATGTVAASSAPASSVNPAVAIESRLTLWASTLTEMARRIAMIVPAWVLLPVCVLALWAVVTRVHTTESLLVLRGLGIQTASTGSTYLSSSLCLPSPFSLPFLSFGNGPATVGAGGGISTVSEVTRFIPTEKIRDVLINEAFRGFEVRYYLVIVVEGEEDVVVVFPKLLPRRKIVETVWRGVRECLYQPDAGVRRLDDKN
ncbi:hypothetical protein VTK73DRAFT_4180 [Phialemonium thermophilum]|uniref:Phosphatidylinositol N-acetylglucosaminyltransferase subunit H conserved domain-containing protein n=1 Tax=Phialemonium thermophilum TaxID=223376 RepID=A0ABR3WVG2_9PEZI